MKTKFTVTIEGKWFYNGKPVTASIVEMRLRKAAKEEFEFLASRVSVKRETQKDILDLYSLVERVSRLNADASEIGAGMLKSLVEDANRILKVK